MQSEIMDGVTRKLDALFGEDARIYTDSVEQGLETPCFFVQFLKVDNKPLLGRRCQRTWHMGIQYIPREEAPARELAEVSETLLEGMEYITLADGTLLRGTDRGCEPSDGVLTYLISFSAILIRAAGTVEPMEELDMKGEVR